jgi:ribonuclease G
MTRLLLREESPGEIRTGLIQGGILVEFRIIRARAMAVGERRAARITSNLGRGRALVLLDGDVEALLEHAPKLTEGARLEVEVIRAPIPEPGRWKRAIVRQASESIAKSERDADIATDCQQIEAAGFEELINAAVVGEFPIENGMLSIERTRAMTMIDIDGSGDALALNLAAAREIPRLLRLLDIGGQIGIDFLSLPDRKARLAVDAVLAEACAVLGPHERTAINGFGFAQIVRPRLGPSVPEVLCGVTPGRLSAESRSLDLLRAASRSVGHGKRQLVAAPVIIDQLRQWTEELEQLRRSLGVEIELVPDANVTGYGHVHVSP